MLNHQKIRIYTTSFEFYSKFYGSMKLRFNEL